MKNKQIEPTIQNHDLVKQVVEMRIKQAMQERYPKAEDVVEDMLTELK